MSDTTASDSDARQNDLPPEHSWKDPSRRLVPGMVLALLIVFGIVVVAIRFNQHASRQMSLLWQRKQHSAAFLHGQIIRQRALAVIDALETLTRSLDRTDALSDENLDAELGDFLEQHSRTVSCVGYMDEKGIIRRQVTKEGPQSGADISFKPHVQQLLSTHQTVVSDLTLASDGQPAIAIHVPLVIGGHFRGSTVATISCKQLGSWLVRAHNDSRSCTVVLDSTGRIAYHPEARFLHHIIDSGHVSTVNGEPFSLALLEDGATGTMNGSMLDDVPHIFGIADCNLAGKRFLLLSLTPYHVVAGPVLRFSRFTSILTGLTFLVSTLGFIYALYLFHIDKSAWMRQRSALRRNIRDHQNAQAERDQLIAELEVKNSELERFAYTVSHDLKSPLITIRGFLGMLKKDIEEGDEQRTESDMARISNATEKMQRLLDELLELSRVGRLSNPHENVDFGIVTAEVLELLTGRLQDSNVTIDVADNLPTVHADKVRFREVMQNLIENAIKFMGDQDEPAIEVGVRDDSRDTVIFVKDNGMGMEPQYAERVFQLFEQLDPNIEGTGMGLTMARKIVEHHGGRIWAESEGPGTGSTFCFTVKDQKEKKRDDSS